MTDSAGRVTGPITDAFTGDALDPHWIPWEIGGGALEFRPADQNVLRCRVAPDSGEPHKTDPARPHYSNAQIADYRSRDRASLRWEPPLRLTVRAWTSHPAAELVGTAGFGFWNEPFLPVGAGMVGLPRLPRAAWFFFAAPPNNMALARDVPGRGWKAATLDATRLPFLLLAPFAPPGFLLMRVPALYRRLWPVGQWALGVSEATLPVDVADPHTYTLTWHRDHLTFAVDSRLVHRANVAPRGPLGFIAWMDNQYAIVTPQGRFGFGLSPVRQTQWLALDRVSIEPLA